MTGHEGNHGEDVKEYYFYLDNTPSHAYMKYLYKYPQQAYPYKRLVEENRRRDMAAGEFELLDTGVFDDNRYFDVFVEYAKASVEDILIQIKVVNRGPETAELHLLPTLWFRNTWSWHRRCGQAGTCVQKAAAKQVAVVAADHIRLGDAGCTVGALEMLFVENESNNRRLFGVANTAAYTKDGIPRLPHTGP